MHDYKTIFCLDKKVAVVTGASGILGTEFCLALCAKGASVACIDVDPQSLHALKEKIKQYFPENNCSFLQCDVANPDAVRAVIKSIVDHYGRIDILLNNAATKTNNLRSFFATFDDYSLETWREIMSVNLDGMFLMAQAVGAQMVLQQSGAMIQTASIYSLIAPDQRIYAGSDYLGMEINTPAVYTTSKAGVIGLTKHLAALWGKDNIRVNAICPGGVESGQNDEFKNRYANRVPLNRMAEKSDITGPMLFLASDAAKYMTGQVLYVDGGLSVW